MVFDSLMLIYIQVLLLISVMGGKLKSPLFSIEICFHLESNNVALQETKRAAVSCPHSTASGKNPQPKHPWPSAIQPLL